MSALTGGASPAKRVDPTSKLMNDTRIFIGSECRIAEGFKRKTVIASTANAIYPSKAAFHPKSIENDWFAPRLAAITLSGFGTPWSPSPAMSSDCNPQPAPAPIEDRRAVGPRLRLAVYVIFGLAGLHGAK